MNLVVHLARTGLVLALLGCAARSNTLAHQGAAVRSDTLAHHGGAVRSEPEYPPTYAFHDDDARARRAESITADLAPDLVVSAVEVDVFGMPASMSFRLEERDQRGPFDDEEAHAWTRMLAKHGSVFGIDDPAALRLTVVGGSMFATQSIGPAAPLARIDVVRHPDAVIVRGHFWPGVRATTQQFDPAAVVASMVGKPYRIVWSVQYRGPHCRGCGSPPPSDRPPQESVTTEHDFLAERELSFVCEGETRASLRPVVRVTLAPRAVRDALDTNEHWRFVGRVVSDDPAATAPQVFDATTGEDLTHRKLLPLSPSDHHVAARGWTPSICGGAPTGA